MPNSPSPPPPTPQLLQLRAGVRWIDDRGMEAISRRDPIIAWALSLFLGGAGQIYLRDYVRGVALTAIAMIGLATLPTYFALLAWLGTGTLSSIAAFRAATALNRYVRARDAVALEAPKAATPVIVHTTVTLHTASAPRALPAPSRSHDPLLAQLRRLGHLHREHVLSDLEFRERKQDLFAGLRVPSRDDLDGVLFDLLAVRDEGLVDADDLEFVKALGVRE